MNRILLAAPLLAGCATPLAPDPADGLFASLSGLCGRAFAGRVVSTDSADADMMGKPLVMHVRECSRDTVRIPFHVGADRSRTWVVTRTPSGLRLKHDHRHRDGSEDMLTQYGGDSRGPGRASTQHFPADAYSVALFRTKGNPASVANVWTMEIAPDRRIFAYQLSRPNRRFRVEFDLSRPVALPPPPWGAR